MVRDDLDVVEVACRPRKMVTDRNDESAQTMELDGVWKERVHRCEKRIPRLRQLRRSGGHQPSSRLGHSTASLPEAYVPPAIAALPGAAMPYTTCLHEQDGFVRAPLLTLP